jgi:hypothetical protein
MNSVAKCSTAFGSFPFTAVSSFSAIRPGGVAGRGVVESAREFAATVSKAAREITLARDEMVKVIVFTFPRHGRGGESCKKNISERNVIHREANRQLRRELSNSLRTGPEDLEGTKLWLEDRREMAAAAQAAQNG